MALETPLCLSVTAVPPAAFQHAFGYWDRELSPTSAGASITFLLIPFHVSVVNDGIGSVLSLRNRSAHNIHLSICSDL